MRTVLILSGGLDSTTLLYKLLADGEEVGCLSFDYGQRHRRELGCAAQVCRLLGVEHHVVELYPLQPLLAGSALSDPGVEVPEGRYSEETMRVTVVPNRNMIMLSIGIAWAVSAKATRVVYAAHSGPATYPDCRSEFVVLVDALARIYDWHPVRVEAPFVHMDKGQIVRLGLSLGVPYQRTWTCYKGGEYPCGVCGACIERREAFEAAGVPDPL